MAGYRSIQLFDWGKGLVNSGVNPLLMPNDALVDGRNVDVAGAGTSTRPGYSLCGEVVPAAATPLDGMNVSRLLFSQLDGAYWCTAIYDPTGDRALICGALDPENSDAEVWAFDCATETLSEVTTTGTPPAATYGQCAVYLGGYMYVFGGDISQGAWRLNCSSHTWETLADIPGDGPVLKGATAVAHDGLIYVYAGSITGASSGVRNGLFRYTPGTDSWETLIAQAGDAELTPPATWKHSADVTDTGMVVFGGDPYGANDSSTVWTMAWSDLSWTSVVEGSQVIPVDLIYPKRRGANWFYHPYFEQFVRLFGAGYESGPLNDVAMYDPATYTWQVVQPIEGADDHPQRELAAGCFDTKRQDILIFGGYDSGGISFDALTIQQLILGEGSTTKVVWLQQVQFPTFGASFLLVQTMAEDGSSKIYASTTPLPTNAAQFTEVYDLGVGAGIVSAAPLNDRIVLTEGVAQPPLVFMGCMSDDGSDFAIAKQILGTLVTNEYFDFTSELCDPDPATTASLDAWPSTGKMYVNLDVPISQALYFEVLGTNSVVTSITVERYAGGGWVPLSVTDGTAVAGKPLAQSGVVSWTPVATDHQEIAELAGFWLRISWGATLSAGTTLSGLRFSAPCQPLQSIGSGTPDNCLGFIYYDQSDGSEKDWTLEVSDEDPNTSARLCTKGTGGATVVAMGSGDAIYLGGATRFREIRLVPGKDNNNSIPATMTVSTWNGSNFVPVSGLSDGTRLSNCTLRQTGKVSWTLPTRWEKSKGYNRNYPLGYWIKITVNTNISQRVYIEEAGVYPIQEDLKKHRFAATIRDRVVLAARPDAPDQIDVSGALQEYLWTGADSYSLRVGGQGQIYAAVPAYNQVWFGKSNEVFMLNGYSPATFASERAETGGHAPVNNRVVVPGPISEADAKVKQGWFFLSPSGAYHFTGLQCYDISKYVAAWWQEDALPRLDMNHLSGACGVYWPSRAWVVWAVPMILTSDQTEQATNNVLIVFDLNAGGWQPIYTIPCAALGPAIHYLPDAPDAMGQRGLYAGGYDGKVYRLFADASDNGEPIVAYIQTGHLTLDEPDMAKMIHSLRVLGSVESGRNVSLDVYVDGESTVRDENRVTLTDLGAFGSRAFAREYRPHAMQGTTFQFKLSWTGPGMIYGIELKVPDVRERPGTGR